MRCKFYNFFTKKKYCLLIAIFEQVLVTKSNLIDVPNIWTVAGQYANNLSTTRYDYLKPY